MNIFCVFAGDKFEFLKLALFFNNFFQFQFLGGRKLFFLLHNVKEQQLKLKHILIEVVFILIVYIYESFKINSASRNAVIY